MTIEQAKSLRRGDVIHEDECVLNVGPRCDIHVKITEWRVSGLPRTWKTIPERVSVPCKHGMYESFRFHEEHLSALHLPSDCPLAGLELWDAAGIEA